MCPRGNTLAFDLCRKDQELFNSCESCSCKPYLVMLQEYLPGKINIFFIIIKMILLMAFILVANLTFELNK
jgi:hypothetical protein